MDNKDQKNDGMASWAFIKEACKKDGDFEGFFARSVMFCIGATLLPFEAVKVGLEKLGATFDNGNENSSGPYDL